MKFNINDYKGDYAIHCKTYKEAEDFCRCIREHCPNASLQPSWYDYYGEQTAYNINGYNYTDVGWYKRHGYTILEWEDFMEKKFTKADLKDGMVVEYRDGDRAMVMGDILMGRNAWTVLNAFSNTLENNLSNLIIDKVYKTRSYTLNNYFKDELLTLIWERKKEEPIKEMTVAEIEKELGYKVKIKSEN